MIRRIKFFYVLSFFSLLFSCADEKVMPYEPPQNSNQLIAGENTKVWKLAKRYNGKTRMNMGDCFLGYRQQFKSDGTVSDNNSKLSDCGPSLTGKWSIVNNSAGFTFIRIESPLLPELMSIKETYKDFRIFYLSKDSLHISFVHKQFGVKRRISDYLVQEDIEAEGRDFHFK